MTKIKFILLTAIILISRFVSADSPLTSTPFHEKYTDVDIVLKAKQTGIMNKEFAEYLHDQSNPIDIKAALINALGWSTENKSDAEVYCNLIFNKQLKVSDLVNLNYNDLFVVGYLKAMDNYFDVSDALPFLKQARIKSNNSYTVYIIEALAKAQKVMDKDFCKVWKYANKVFTNDDLDLDMRKDARKIIYDYIIIYKNDCK